ncbi:MULTISPECIES: ferredoxin [unclassified Streptomyces]|uniref:ferredoxin n=1 Tax=unclassified Streptomyces TaxID=2593676 RepID=UPI003631DC03
MEVQLDQDKCCGAGQCVLVAPEVFDQRDEDGIAFVLDARPPAALHEQVREAALICPAAAIRLEQ